MECIAAGTRALSALALLGLGLSASSEAALGDVGLQNATATHSATNPCCPDLFHPRNTIDGFFGRFWSINRPVEHQAETIVWETEAELTLGSAMTLKFSLHHNAGGTAGHNLGRFRLSYTTDDRALFADGLDIGGAVAANWVVIAPGAATSNGGEVFTILADASILVSGVTSAQPTYTVTSSFAASGITGFRLEALKDPSLPFGGPGRQPANGNFHLDEFLVTVVPEPASGVLMLLGLAAIQVFRSMRGSGKSGQFRKPCVV
jgi:hypothetical protein